MKSKLILLILIILTILAFTGCEKKGVNILEQNQDYVGEFTVPSSSKLKQNSALSIIAAINESGYKVKTATKTQSDDIEILESYIIDCYGVNIEIFHYSDNSSKLREIKTTGKYCINNENGEVLREFIATTNGNYVLFFSGSVDSYGNDKSKDNNKIVEIFNNLDLN